MIKSAQSLLSRCSQTRSSVSGTAFSECATNRSHTRMFSENNPYAAAVHQAHRLHPDGHSAYRTFRPFSVAYLPRFPLAYEKVA